ncbi:hypothetical protein [Paraburkholderia sp. BCC1876]|uniref:hypothetical protein n=1 Tax=Paraburkholderia sp. BCC1876 TaxID=2676303 RepID=UPI00158FA048|nr:hypothetical protein [Paraburkholderia sp. BCC1876]
MSGAAGARGYLLQALTCVLESLDWNNEWKNVTIESSLSEKIDIIWEFQNGDKRAIQVKSSQNPFSKGDVDRWVAELQALVVNDPTIQAELQLIGNIATGVHVGKNGDVLVAQPLPLSFPILIGSAAHQLDKYLANRTFAPCPAFARELIIEGLTTRLSEMSTRRATYQLADFRTQLQTWLLHFYVRATDNAYSMQCEGLFGPVIFPAKDYDEIGLRQLGLVCNFYNGGQRTAIIEWVALQIEMKKKKATLEPVHLIVDLDEFMEDDEILRRGDRFNPFRPINIASYQSATATIVFRLTNEYDAFAVKPGDEFQIKVVAKLADAVTPRLFRKLKVVYPERLRDQAKAVSMAVQTFELPADLGAACA